MNDGFISSCGKAFRGNVFGELNDERKEVSFWGSRMSTFCSSRVLAARNFSTSCREEQNDEKNLLEECIL